MTGFDAPMPMRDQPVKAQIRVLLLELQRECGAAALLPTCNMSAIGAIDDQMPFMQNGALAQADRCANVPGRPAHEYTRTLLAALPRHPCDEADDGDVGHEGCLGGLSQEARRPDPHSLR